MSRKKKKQDPPMFRLRDQMSYYQKQQTNPRNWKQKSLDKERKKSEDTYERNNPVFVSKYNEARKKMNLAPKRPVEKDYQEMFGRSRMFQQPSGKKKKSLTDTGMYNRWTEYYKAHPERKTVKQAADTPYKYAYKGQKKAMNTERKKFDAQYKWGKDSSTEKYNAYVKKATDRREAEKFAKTKSGKFDRIVGEGVRGLEKHVLKPFSKKWKEADKKGIAAVRLTNKALKGAGYLLDKYDRYAAAPVRNIIETGQKNPNKIKTAATPKEIYKNLTDKRIYKGLKKDITDAWKDKRRASGEEIAKRADFTKSKYLTKIAGFGIEAAADPSSYIGGAAIKGAAKKVIGRKAAKKATQEATTRAEKMLAEMKGASKAARERQLENVSKLSPEGAENLKALGFGKEKFNKQLLLEAPKDKAAAKNLVKFTAKNKGLKYKGPKRQTAATIERVLRDEPNVYGVSRKDLKPLVRKTIKGKYEKTLPMGRPKNYDADLYHDFIAQAKKPTIDEPFKKVVGGTRGEKLDALIETFTKRKKPDTSKLDAFYNELDKMKPKTLKQMPKAGRTPKQKAAIKKQLDEIENNMSEKLKEGQYKELETIRDFDKTDWLSSPEARNMRDEIDSKNRKKHMREMEHIALKEHSDHYDRMLESIGKDPQTGKQMRINLGDNYDDYADLVPKHLLAKKGSKGGVPLDVYLEQNRNIFGVKGTEEDFLERLSRGYEARKELKGMKAADKKETLNWDFKNPDEHMDAKYLESERGANINKMYEDLAAAKLEPKVTPFKELPVTEAVKGKKLARKNPQKRINKKDMAALLEDAGIRSDLAREATNKIEELPAATPLEQMQEQFSRFAPKEHPYTLEETIDRMTKGPLPKARTQYKDGAGPILPHQAEANNKIRDLVNQINKWGEGPKPDAPVADIGRRLEKGAVEDNPLQFKKEILARKEGEIPRPDYHPINPDMPEVTKKLLEDKNRELAFEYKAKQSQLAALKTLDDSVAEPEYHPITDDMPDATKEVLEKENEKLKTKYESDRAKVEKQKEEIAAKLGLNVSEAEVAATTMEAAPKTKRAAVENIGPAPATLDPTTAPLKEVFEPDAVDLPPNEDARGIIRENINREAPVKEKVPFKERIKKLGDDFYTNFVDDFYGVTKREKAAGIDVSAANSATGRAHRANSSSVKAKQELVDGYFDKDGNKTGKSYVEVVEGAKDFEKTIDFMVAQRINDYTEKDLKAIASGNYRQSDVAKKAIADAIKDNPKILDEVKAAREFLKNQQDILVEGGIFNEKNMAKMREDNPNYIRFERDMSDKPENFATQGKGGAAKRFANQKNPIKARTGTISGRKINAPEHVIMKTQYVYNALAEQNKVGQAVLDLIKKSGDDNGFAKIVDVDENYAYKLKKDADEIIEGDAEVDDKQFDSFFRPKDKQNMLYIYDNGNRYHVKVEDKDFYNSMISMNSQQNDLFSKILHAPASILRSGVTLAPDFSVKNWFRDQFTTAMASDVGYRPVWDSLQGYKELRKDKALRKKGETNPLVQAYHRNGGDTSIIRDIDKDSIVKTYEEIGKDKSLKAQAKEIMENPKLLLKKPFTLIGGGLRHLGDVSEQSTRLGHMKRAMKTGQSAEEAAYTARKAMDFGRGGKWSKKYNNYTAFFNATAQGLDVFTRSLANPATRKKAIASIGGFITAPTLALYALNHDEDWYQEIPLAERDKNWYFKFPKTDQVVKVPKPFEPGIIFGASLERALEAGKALKEGKDLKGASKEFAGYGKSMLDSLTPDMIPTMLKPLLETWGDRSLAFDSPIESMGDQFTNPSDRKTPYTSEIAKLVGRGIEKVKPDTEISPKDIDNIIRNVGGTLGTVGNELLDYTIRGLNPNAPKRPNIGPQDIPFMRSFLVRNLEGNNRSTQEFYDTQKKMTRRKLISENVFGKDYKYQDQLDTFDDKRSEIDDYQTEKKKVLNNTKMSSDKKTAELKRINAEIRKIAREGLKYRP